MVKDKDRQQSEQKLIDAVGELIIENGFENIGINQVAKKAGFSKNLIYRYFGSLDGLVHAYIKRHDFWINARDEKPGTSDIKAYLKAFYRREISGLRDNTALKRLRRWELSTDKDFVVDIREQREKNGVRFTNLISGFVKTDKEKLQAVSALIDAGITYLGLIEENCRMYNGIDIRSDDGWENITEGIDFIIDTMIK